MLRIVLCNCPVDHGPVLARSVVEAGLAACVNVSPPIRSVYRWEGKIEDEPEVMLWMKTESTVLPALRSHILAHHPYAVPEILVLPVDESLSHAPYVAWVRSVVTDGGAR